jgi:histidinol-phosphate aminotransferase
VIVPRDEVRTVHIADHGGRLALGDEQGEPADDFVDFSVCLNAHGPAPSIVEAVRAAPVDEYPDPRSLRPRRLVAERWGATLASIVVGAGSAELIHAVCFAYVRPGDVVVVIEPAFGEYRRAAALCGANVLGTSASSEADVFSGALTEIRKRRPRLVFVASPVNPTGAAFDRETLRTLADCCAEHDGLLVLDQAYDAFSDRPLGTPALAAHSNVLHLRSLTKEHALAGVRVAVGVGPAQVVASVERARVPWATTAAAQAALIATFNEDARTHARSTIASLRVERARIAAAIQALGAEPSPTTTHYMLIRCRNATEVRDHLMKAHRILVRDCTSFGLPRHIRIAARLARENDRLIHALQQTLS